MALQLATSFGRLVGTLVSVSVLAATASASAQASSACARTITETDVRMQIAPEGVAPFSVRVAADTARVDLTDNGIEVVGSIRASGTGAISLPWVFSRPYADPTGAVHVAAGQSPTLSRGEGRIEGSVRLGYGLSVGALPVECDAVTLERVTRGPRQTPAEHERVDGTRWSPTGGDTRVFARPDPDAPSVLLQARDPEDVALQRTDTRPGWLAIYYGSGRAYVAGWVRSVDLRPYQERRGGGGAMAGRRGPEEAPADYEGPIQLPEGHAIYADREQGEWARSARALEATARWTVRSDSGDQVWVQVLALPGVRELRPGFGRELRPSPRLTRAWARVPLASIPGGAAILARVTAARPTSPGEAALTAARAERGIRDASPLAVGGSHACALRGGAVRCWGNNERGQLGDGTTIARDHAEGVSGLEGVTSVVAAAGGTCALKSDGEVWCWGADDTPESRRPTRVDGLEGTIAISGGAAARLCALDGMGAVRCGTRDSPVERVDGVADAIAIAASPAHTCALRVTGSVVCWGDNGAGALGVEGRATTTRPVAVPDVADAVGLWAGSDLSCARVRSGGLWCWGQVPAQSRRRRAPAELPELSGARHVAISRNALCTLGDNGPIRCLAGGYGDRPVLAGASNFSGPAEIPGTGGARALALGYGDAACLLDTEGVASCWGRRTAHRPREVHGLTGAHTLRAGYGRSCAAFRRTATSEAGPASGIQCWPDTRLAANVGSAVDFDIAAGGMCAVGAEGTVQCRGMHERSWRGATGVTAVSLATSIGCAVVDGSVQCHIDDGRAADPGGVLGPVVDVSVDRNRVCSVERSGRVVCWGVVYDHEGDGSEPDPPTVVPGVSDAVEVRMGSRHGCVRRRNGAITCFTEDGVLDLPGFRDARGFDVEGNRVCIADANGRVHCLRFHGRSDDTHRAHYDSPVRVEGVNDATAVALGDANRSCALRETGQVVCWGNATGGLADGETGPVRVEER